MGHVNLFNLMSIRSHAVVAIHLGGHDEEGGVIAMSLVMG